MFDKKFVESLFNNFITARNEVGARVCFYRCVWFCSQGGVPDQVHPSRPGTPPGTRYTPQTRSGGYTPKNRYTPGTRYTPNQVHPPRPGTAPGPGTPPDQVHPPGPGTPPGTRYTPWDQVHPCPGIPPDQVHPPVHPPRDQGDTVYARAVRILLECILVWNAIW